MRSDDFIGQKFHWFTGEIEDIDDPKGFNRVRVRCHGYHPPYKKVTNTVMSVLLPGSGSDSVEVGVKTKDLPWATVMMPATSAGTPNVGANHHLEKGSWVFGFFRDGPSAQDPVIMGSMTSSTDAIADLHSAASITNKIYHSKAGHLIEIENKERVDAVAAVAAVEAVVASEGVEAVEAVAEIKEVSQSGPVLRVTHAGGTKIEIDEDNNLTIYVEEGGDLGITVKKGDTTIQTQEGDTTIQTQEGDTTIATGGDTTISSTGNTTLVAGGKTDIVSGEEITITSAVSTTIV